MNKVYVPAVNAAFKSATEVNNNKASGKYVGCAPSVIMAGYYRRAIGGAHC